MSLMHLLTDLQPGMTSRASLARHSIGLRMRLLHVVRVVAAAALLNAPLLDVRGMLMSCQTVNLNTRMILTLS